MQVFYPAYLYKEKWLNGYQSEAAFILENNISKASYSSLNIFSNKNNNNNNGFRNIKKIKFPVISIYVYKFTRWLFK